MPKRTLSVLVAGAALAFLMNVAAAAPATRAKADVTCKPTGTTLEYDCVVKLINARTNEPLNGITLSVGADMPSMPMMHNVRPVTAKPGQEAGAYEARLLLEMHGDWAVQLNLSGPVRDRVFVNLRFEPDRVTPATAPTKAAPRHKH